VATDTVELRRTEPDDRPPAPPAPPGEPTDRRIPGGRLAVGLAILVLLFLFVGQVLDFLPRFGNPFGQRTVDRSQPVLLQSIQDLSHYEAATGNFQVIIDLEKDARFIPAIVRGERTLFIAAGSVDVSVDFSTLQAGSIEVSQDRDAVRIVLPHHSSSAPTWTAAAAMCTRSSAACSTGSARSSPATPSNQQQPCARREKIQAAAAESGLVERAETNTRAMLTGMLQSLGFRTIDVGSGLVAARRQ
jgi:hypothetical protein